MELPRVADRGNQRGGGQRTNSLDRHQTTEAPDPGPDPDADRLNAFGQSLAAASGIDHTGLLASSSVCT
jgi:hypothetical protein